MSPLPILVPLLHVKWQASSVWGAIAKVLGDEDSKRMSKVLALFAISTNTMEPRCESVVMILVLILLTSHLNRCGLEDVSPRIS